MKNYQQVIVDNNSDLDLKYKKRKVPFVGMMGWAVNSMVNAVKGSIPFLSINIIHVFNL